MPSTKKRTSAAPSETRETILAAAGQRLREEGLHGIGVDGLLAAAGLTSGAFYAQFRSKTQLFREVVVRGLAETRQRLLALRDRGGDGWFPDGVLAYLDEAHLADVRRGCILPSLTADVARSDGPTRRAFEEGVRGLIDEIEAALPAEKALSARQRAWSTLALAAGTMVLARAVASPAVAREILGSSQALVRRMARRPALW